MHKSNLPECEFCSELNLPEQSRFKKLYGKVLPSRIISETSNFVVLPTIGQLYEGSLLIISKQHIEDFSCLPTRLVSELETLIKIFQNQVSSFGYPFIFEHGAKRNTGGGCGIYHAHIHIVPLPEPVNCDDILEFPGKEISSLISAWEILKDSNEYILIKDCFSKVYYLELPAKNFHFPSQYCRKRIAEYFNLNQPWDWHQYDYVEDFMISTFNSLKSDILVSKNSY